MVLINTVHNFVIRQIVAISQLVAIGLGGELLCRYFIREEGVASQRQCDLWSSISSSLGKAVPRPFIMALFNPPKATCA